MSVSLPFRTAVSIGLTVDKVTFVRSTMKPRLLSNLGLRPRYEKRLCFMVSVRNYYYYRRRPFVCGVYVCTYNHPILTSICTSICLCAFILASFIS